MKPRTWWVELVSAVAQAKTSLTIGAVLATVGLGLLTSGVVFVRNTYRDKVAAAEQRGRDAEREKARVLVTRYVVSIGPLLARRDSAIAHTDNVLRTHTSHARAAAAAIASVPQAVRDSQPVVDAALTASEILIADTAAIARAVMTERVAHRDVHIADSTALVAMAGEVVTWKDSTTIARVERDKRPKWSTVGKVGVTALGVGFTIGKWIVPALQQRRRP